MEKLTFIYSLKDNVYRLVEQKIKNTDTVIILEFLDSDVGNSVDYYIKLLQNREFKYGMGNVTTLYKPGDGAITLTFYPFEDMDPEPEFKTTVENLIKILRDWDYIHKKKFPKVLMTVDGDKVAFEPIEITET